MAKARVLAVDDQRYFRELIAGLLGEEGYEVQTAASGEEALHLLERNDYEVVVTDLVMPGLDGADLCRQIKEQWPEQDVVMVTGVVDVQTAVETMKLGATDYILKPFDRDTLVASLQTILQRHRLREENARLMAESLEYMSALTLYERASGLFSTLETGALAERLIEGLCLETRAQGGVVWLATGTDGGPLELSSTCGLIRAEDQLQELSLGSAPRALQESLESGQAWLGEDGQLGPVLWVPLRSGPTLLGAVRLSDKLEGQRFEDRDRLHAERFANFGGTAVSNALRFRSLERRSFRDPVSKAYTRAYFQDVVRNEIQKAGRFGRSFSLIRWRIEDFASVRRTLSEGQRARWLERLLEASGQALRATDLLAVHGEDSFAVLLPETDTLGASRGVQRIRDALAEAPPEGPAPVVAVAAATYPGDGTQLETLERALDQRVDDAAESLVGLVSGSFEEALGQLLERTEASTPDLRARIERFVIEDFGRRTHERGLLFVAPPPETLDAVTEWVEAAGGEGETSVHSEILVAAPDWHERRGRTRPAGGVPITWIDPRRVGAGDEGLPSLLLYFGDGPAYAQLSLRTRGDAQAPIQSFQTHDRSLVEHLALQLQRELGIGGPA